MGARQIFYRNHGLLKLARLLRSFKLEFHIEDQVKWWHHMDPMAVYQRREDGTKEICVSRKK